MSNSYGRITIYAPYSEAELLSMSETALKNVLKTLLPDIISIHNTNKQQTKELWNYYLGQQDILTEKQKLTREDINNKKVENWAYAIVDFKKNWLVGDPIQYTMASNTSNEEIQKLNKYVSYENKDARDQELVEDVYVVGRGFRFTKQDVPVSEDEAPFSLFNVKRDNCEVIYSSNIDNEQLFSIVETEMVQRLPTVDKLGNKVMENQYYSDYTIYFRNKLYVVSYKTGSPRFVKTEQIVLNEHLITEWYINRDRISLIEIGKDLFNGINQLESDDFDDLDQFVNAIMVFTNADIDEEGLEEMKELGAIKIKSTENRKASVDTIANRLNASDTQVFYTRLLVALHQILGVPMATDNGSVTSGDTGRAKMTGQGFTSAGIRAKTDQTMIKSCDRKGLRLILKICKSAENSVIKNLKVSEVDIKFNIDKSENLLTKSEALNILISLGVPKEFAVPLVNLFGDPTAVVAMWNQLDKESKEKEQAAAQNNGNNAVTKAQEVNNKNTNFENKQDQEK